MFSTQIFFAITLSVAAFLSLFGPALAQDPTEPNTGKIICISPNNPHICQVRYTSYYQEDPSMWPKYKPSDYPYNGNKYPQANYDVWVDVYDGFCNHIGLAVGYEVGQISVDSQLPWTVEIDAPQGYARLDDVRGMYAGQAIFPSTHVVTYTDPGTKQPWGFMGTGLFGFPC